MMWYHVQDQVRIRTDMSHDVISHAGPGADTDRHVIHGVLQYVP